MKAFFVGAFLSFCLVLASAKTKCETEREHELNSKEYAKLVPKCDENGDYEALQCLQGTSFHKSFCTCFRTDGTRITQLSRKIKTCACHAHRDRELKRSESGIVGNFVPSCEEDGTYSKQQCHGSTGFCWCADENGNRVSEQVRGAGLNC